MLDLFLMILFCVRLFRRCAQAGVRSTWHIARLVGYWILSEILGMFLFMQIGFDVLFAALCAIALGVVAGGSVLSKEHDGDQHDQRAGRR